jgi:Flp pilus assembly pilin Flp
MLEARRMAHEIVGKLKTVLNNKGQGLLEYILILGFIALVVAASLTSVGITLAGKFAEFTAAMIDNT